MRKLIAPMALLAALAVALAAPALAGDSGSSAWGKLQALLGNKREEDHFKVIHVADLAALRAGNTNLAIYDANTPGVRARYGEIPGARLLSSPEHYDVAAELPSNKHIELIFYCTDSH